MALATSVTGDGKLLSRSSMTRNLRDAGESFFNLTETIENETREWVAVTQAAAETARAAGYKTGMTVTGTGTTYEYSVDEDVRVIGSYVYRCSAEKKTIAF
jgi:hypothetical protein